MTLEIFPDFPEKKSHQQSGVPAIGRPNLVGQSATLSALQRSSHWPEVWESQETPRKPPMKLLAHLTNGTEVFLV